MNAPIVTITKMTDRKGENSKLAPPKVSSRNTPTTKPTNPINADVNIALKILLIQSHAFAKFKFN